MAKNKDNKKPSAKFKSKNIKHDPQAESARAVFGLKNETFNNKAKGDLK